MQAVFIPAGVIDDPRFHLAETISGQIRAVVFGVWLAALDIAARGEPNLLEPTAALRISAALRMPAGVVGAVLAAFDASGLMEEGLPAPGWNLRLAARGEG